jgi:hypothetical protein
VLAVEVLGLGRISSAGLFSAADPHFAFATVQRPRVGAAGDLQRGHRGLANGRAERNAHRHQCFLWRAATRGRHDSRTFDVVEIPPNEAYLKHLLHEFDADIQHFNPGFSGDDAAHTDLGFLILTGAETVGLVLARNAGDGSAQVDLDYVVPRYQGFTLGEFVYRPDGPLAARGYRRVIAPPRMQNAGDYLTDVGFRPEGGAMVRDLA